MILLVCKYVIFCGFEEKKLFLFVLVCCCCLWVLKYWFDKWFSIYLVVSNFWCCLEVIVMLIRDVKLFLFNFFIFLLIWDVIFNREEFICFIFDL